MSRSLALFLRLLFLAAGLSLPAFSASAATLGVPTQYATIQAAVSAASNGDTVLIADGTYTGPGNVDIDFGGKNITVTSQHGAASTIIDCGGSASTNHRGFYLHSGETSAVISGLTIQHGYEGNNINSSGVVSTGGGLYISGSRVSVQNCVIKNNTASGYGGGGGLENVSGGNTTLTNCVFTGNTAASYGGGIENGYQGSSVTLTNCTVTGNTAYNGSGIANNTDSTSSGTMTLTNDIIYGDTNSETAGGNITSYHCDIASDPSNLNADPLFFSNPSDLHLQASSRCLGAGTASGAPATTIDGRTRPTPPSIGAYEAGLTGPVTTTTALTSSLNPSIAGQLVTFTATIKGTSGTPTGTVTFFAYGSALGTAPLVGQTAVYQTFPGSTSITAVYSGDAVFAPSTSPPLVQVVNLATTTIKLSSSLNPAAFGQQIVFTANLTGSNPIGYLVFTDNGAFLGYGALYGLTATYATASLSAGTHQIAASYQGDASNTASASAPLAQVVTPHVSPLYVSPIGSDSNIGTQAAPKLTIQAAMNIALGGDTVVIEDGTYTGLGNVDLDFLGKNLIVTSQHGAATTIINCAGFTSTDGSGNHRGFYLHRGEINAVISGLTIENGYEIIGNGSSSGGGAIYAACTGLTIQNCIITTNTAGGYGAGGGIYSIPTSNGMLTVVNCVLIGNVATQGGGIYSDTTNTGTLSVTNCTITNNTTTSFGAGIYNTSTPFGIGVIALTNDIFYNNPGGGFSSFVKPSVSNCDIQDSQYPAGSGIINADPLFVNTSTDLHLLPGSPCLGAGTAIGAPALTIDGRTRPNPPSIGAYEIYVAPTAVTVANASGTAGQTVTLSAALGNPGGAGLSGRTLSFSVDGAAAGTAVTNSAGTAALPYAIPAGTTVGGHALSASFAGDMTNSASSGIGTLTVAAAGPVPASQARFAPRVGWGSRMVGGKFQGSSDGVSYTTLATITQAPPDNQLTTLTFASPAAYRFLRYLAPNGAYGNISELEFDSGTGASAAKISGTPFGTPGSWANQGNDFTKAFDGSTSTYFDAPDPGNGDFVGIDQGSATPNQVRYFPRVGWESRMVGGKFQGSSDGVTYTTLATVTQAPGDAYTTVPLSVDPAAYRFLRYLAPNGAYGNIAELEFDSQGKKLTGTAFGTAGSYAGSGNDFTKVFDGTTSTFFDAPSPGNGDFAGIDQGAGVTALGEVHFTPRAAWASRMVGGRFQGSADGVTYTDLAAIGPAPPDGQQTVTMLAADPKSYRFLRYLAPDGAYGNIAELAFYSGTGASAVKIGGTPFGTPGSYANSGNDFTKAFDGNVSTYFDAPSPGNGDFAGIDQGAP